MSFAIIGTAEEIRELLCGPQQHDEHTKAWRWNFYIQDSKRSMAAVDAESKRLIAEYRARRASPQNHCDCCGDLTVNPEDDYGEFICESCLENAAEAAWERHCEDFHDGGSTRFISLEQRQADARRFK